MNAVKKTAHSIFAKIIISSLLILTLCVCNIYAYGEDHGIPSPPEPSAEAAYIYEMTTDTIIYEKNAREQMYPASITKIMTALLAAEHIESGQGRLEDIITFSYNAIYGIPRDTMHISIDVGEQLTVLQVLYAILLPSANEACLGMAEYVSGSVDEFVLQMNEKAKALGLKDTNFVTANGLHDPKHYTTAKDLTVIMQEVLKHELIKEIMSTASYDIPPTNKTASLRRLTNSNKLIVPGSGQQNSYVVCGKTGFTTPAGNTLIVYSEKDGLKYITVILKAGQGTINGDMNALVNYVADNFKIVNVDNFVEYTVSVPTFEGGHILVKPQDIFPLLIHTEDDFTRFERRYDLPTVLKKPVTAGEFIGRLELYDGSVRVGGVDLVAVSNSFVSPTEPESTTAPSSQPIQTPIDDKEEPTPEKPIEQKRSEFISNVAKLALIVLFVAIFCIIIYGIIILVSVFIHSKRKKENSCRLEDQETHGAIDNSHQKFTMLNILDEGFTPTQDQSEED